MLHDQTLAMLRRGYTFGAGVLGPGMARDAAPLRFLGRPALLVTGEAGVRFFYDGSRLTRVGAVPRVVGDLLFGRGGLQGLDGPEHTARRALFLDLLDEEGVAALTEVVRRRWQEAQYRWVDSGSVRLHDAAVEVLGRSVLEWAGARVPDPSGTAHDLAAIIDGFGSFGLAHLRGRLARRRCERLARACVHTARRTASPGASPRSPLDVVAHARDLDGALLAGSVAAVELLNLLRPVVAIAWFADFAALALAQHPRWRERVGTAGREVDRTAFVHEIRRYYPLTPLLAARARGELSFDGHTVQPGQHVLLDVIGVNHDPRLWVTPWRFEPERFLHRRPGDDFVAQGAGPWETGHRCPGEPLTVALLREVVRALADLPFRIAPAELSFPAHRVPTRPLRGPVLRDLGTATTRSENSADTVPRPPGGGSRGSHAELVAAVREQHRRITDQLTRTRLEHDHRRARFTSLRRLVALHEAAERATIHPLLGKGTATEAGIGAEMSAEEDEAANLVDRLDSFDVASYEFVMQLQLLEQALTYHATAEEERELPLLANASEADLRRAIAALATVTMLSGPDSDWSPPDHPFRALRAAAAEQFAAELPPDGKRRDGKPR